MVSDRSIFLMKVLFHCRWAVVDVMVDIESARMQEVPRIGQMVDVKILFWETRK